MAKFSNGRDCPAIRCLKSGRCLYKRKQLFKITENRARLRIKAFSDPKVFKQPLPTVNSGFDIIN